MGVEFLPTDQPGHEPGDQAADDRQAADLDVLEVGRVAVWPGRRWSHQRVWWLAAALLAVGVTALALTHPPPSPSPRRVVERAVTATPRVAPACRKLPDCSVRAEVPAAIDQLARAYLPAGVDLRVHTVVEVNSLTLGNLLVSRDIDATVDSVTVLIRVQRGGSGKHEIVPDPLGMGSLLLHGVNSGFVVRLQYLAPETVPPMVGRLQALIRDPRLTSSSD